MISPAKIAVQKIFKLFALPFLFLIQRVSAWRVLSDSLFRLVSFVYSNHKKALSVGRVPRPRPALWRAGRGLSWRRPAGFYSRISARVKSAIPATIRLATITGSA